MTKEKASKMVKAALECMERDVSGCDEMCNSHKCDECALNYEKGNMGEQKEWLRLAIKALEQEPYEDCVRRQEVIDVLKDKWGMFSDADDAMQESIDTIRALKSVTPQPKEIGHWIADVDRWGDIVTTVNGYRCSECNAFDTDKDNYCPNCGCAMKGDKK